MRFQVIFTYDPEYKGYVADVPELPGCMSQGKNLKVIFMYKRSMVVVLNLRKRKVLLLVRL